MVLHTIISEYDIFRDESQLVPPEYTEIENGTGFLEYEEFNGQKRIKRLHSTDPYMYLQNEYSPYSIIN